MDNDFGRDLGNGLTVIVRDNNVMKAYRKLKKKMQNEKVFHELRERRHYVKPTTKRRQKKAAARKRC